MTQPSHCRTTVFNLIRLIISSIVPFTFLNLFEIIQLEVWTIAELDTQSSDQLDSQ